MIGENKRLKGDRNDESKLQLLPSSPPPVSPITISSTPPPPVESNYHQSPLTGQSDQNWSLSNFGSYHSSAPALPTVSIFGSLEPTTRLNSTTPYFPVDPSMQPTYQSAPPQLFMEMLDDCKRDHYNLRQEPDFDNFLTGLMQL